MDHSHQSKKYRAFQSDIYLDAYYLISNSVYYFTRVCAKKITRKQYANVSDASRRYELGLAFCEFGCSIEGIPCHLVPSWAKLRIFRRLTTIILIGPGPSVGGRKSGTSMILTTQLFSTSMILFRPLDGQK